MTNFLRRAAFDRPFDVRVVKGEVFVVSRQAPVELVLTAQSARATAFRLLAASAAIDRDPVCDEDDDPPASGREPSEF